MPHLEAAKEILKYINCMVDMELLYRSGANFSLLGYTDADLEGDLNDRRSMSGYVFLCGGSGMPWCTKNKTQFLSQRLRQRVRLPLLQLKIVFAFNGFLEMLILL